MNASDNTGDRRLDVNALGGPLAELFVPDLTAATVTCAHCGGEAALAAYHVYADAPALVVRCPGCTSLVLAVAWKWSAQASHRHGMSQVNQWVSSMLPGSSRSLRTGASSSLTIDSSEKYRRR